MTSLLTIRPLYARSLPGARGVLCPPRFLDVSALCNADSFRCADGMAQLEVTGNWKEVFILA